MSRASELDVDTSLSGEGSQHTRMEDLTKDCLDDKEKIDQYNFQYRTCKILVQMFQDAQFLVAVKRDFFQNSAFIFLVWLRGEYTITYSYWETVLKNIQVSTG